MTWLAILVLAVVTAAGLVLVRRRRKDAAEEKSDQQKISTMKRDLASDGVDDGSPVVADIVQAARERGEV